MDIARGLLAHPARSVREVANKPGYDDLLYSSAQFKKRAGVPPSQVQRDSRATGTVRGCHARSFRLRILPVGLRGSSSITRISRGHL